MKAFSEKKAYQQDANFKKYRKPTYRQCILPYILYHFIQEPVFTRVKKLFAIILRKETMQFKALV